MNYFRLNEETYFVNGTNPAVYNLFTGEIYLMNQRDAKTIVKLESNQTISNSEEAQLSRFLKEKGLGQFHSQQVFIEKVNLLPDWYDYLYFSPAPLINRVSICLTDCVYNCENCNIHNYRRYSPCLCNSKEIPIKCNLSFDDITHFLDNLRKLRVKEVLITGNCGDRIDKFKVIEYAINANINTVGFVHCYRDLDNIDYNKLFEMGAHLYLQVNHNEISEEALKKVLALDPLKATILLQVKYKEEDPNPYINFFKKNRVNYLIDFVFPKTIKKEEISNLYHRNIPKVNARTYSLARKRNKCLTGSFATLPNGDIVPCFGLENNKVGNIKDFSNIFSDSGLFKYWNLNSDSITPCKTCGLRYACNDCRGLETRLGANIYQKITCMR